jgi:hypothetical protein
MILDLSSLWQSLSQTQRVIQSATILGGRILPKIIAFA